MLRWLLITHAFREPWSSAAALVQRLETSAFHSKSALLSPRVLGETGQSRSTVFFPKVLSFQKELQLRYALSNLTIDVGLFLMCDLFPTAFTRTPWNRLTGEADDGAVRNREVFFLFLIIFFFSMWKGLVNWSIDRSEFVVQVQMKSWCHASVTDNVSERGIQKTGKIYFDICDFVNWNFTIENLV